MTASDIDNINNSIVQKCHEVCEKTGLQTNFNASAIYLNKKANSLFAKINSEQLKVPCFRPFYSFDVSVNGDTYPCCWFIGEGKYRIGNIFETPIDSIFYSKAHRKFLKGLIPPIKYQHCGQCWSSLDDNLEHMTELKTLNANEMLNKLCVHPTK